MRRNKIMALIVSVSMLVPCFNTAMAEDYIPELSVSVANTNGNIIFDITADAVLEIDATKVDANERLYAKVGIKTQSGDLIIKDIVELSEDKKANYTISSIPEYGIYSLEVNLYGKDSNRYYGQCQSYFSVVNAPENGKLNPVHGVCIHYRAGQDRAAFGDALVTTELAAKAGFSSARGEVTWEKYASYDDDGNVTYSLADRQGGIISKTSDLGMDVLEILSYDHPKYHMANASGVYNTQMTAPFVAYAQSLASKIKSLNDGAEFELWNEWNNEGSWFNEQALSPQAYAKLAKAVYEKLEGTATIWGMSTLGVDTKWIEKVLEEWDDDGYFWQNKNDNQKLYMDGISVHPYANWSQPEGSTYINTPKWAAKNPVYVGPVDTTIELKEMLNSRGIGETKLRATEWGWVSTGAKAYQNNSSTDSTQVFVGYYPDRVMQAAYFVRMAALSEAEGLYDKMDYYQINSKNGADDSDYGLLMSSTSNVPYGAKPAYLAAANYNRIMTGAVPRANAVKSKDDVYMTCFKLADGNDCAIVWSSGLDKGRTKPENVKKDISLSLGDTEVTICDMLGNETALTSATGEYNLKVSGEPVYVIGNFTEHTFTDAQNGALLKECYYNKLNNKIVIKADASEAEAVLKQDGQVKQELELTTLGNKIDTAIDMDTSLDAGDYVLEFTANGNTYSKAVTISNNDTVTSSEFAPGMVALYQASTRNVRVIGKLADRNEKEPIIVMVAKAPEQGAEITEKDIAYAEVFDGSMDDFELEFTIPEGEYGDYVVRAGAMYANNAVQSTLSDPDNAVVCTFTAAKENDSISATATFANHSDEDVKSAMIIIAQYGENDELTSINFKEYDVNKAYGITEETFTQQLDSQAVKCSAYVWNSMGEMIPLAPVINIGGN